MEECPLHRDLGWEGSASSSRLLINEVPNDSAGDDVANSHQFTFPLDQNASSELLKSSPGFTSLDVWFQLLVIHTAVLTFGMPTTGHEEAMVHPVHLLPPSVMVS